MDAFLGTFRDKVCTDPNLDAFLETCNIPKNMRELYKERIHEVTVSKGDNDSELKISIKGLNDPKLITYTLEVGKETEHYDIDGVHRKVFTTFDGKTLVERYIGYEGNVEIFVHRSMTASGMITKTSCNGISFKQEWVKC